MAEAETGQGASARQKILATDRAADGKKAFCQWRFHAGKPGSRDQKRQSKPKVLAHVAVLRQRDTFAPVAGIGKAVMRAAAIHPFLAVCCIMVCQRKMRCGIAKPLAHRDT